MMAASETHFDVIIIGAGISGVCAAYYLQTKCPSKSYAILEARGAIGGTWDLFRYPGVRSDSDMFTLGYSFRPWPKARAIADGPAIRDYVEETADAFGISDRIRFNTRVETFDWSSADRCWRLHVTQNGEERIYTADFVISCAGYYRYSEGYAPDFPGADRFAGEIIHPQHWPEDYDYAGKRIVIIGSGATAVTLAPSLADKAAHVTVLQRSPSYLFSMPGESGLARRLKQWLPRGAAHAIMRWQRIIFQQFSFKVTRATPARAAKNLIKMVKDRLPPGYDTKKHFTPHYDPWDQRLCVVPDDDFFNAIKAGKLSMATDHIDRLDEAGIRLKSGERLDADVIVTATGLVMQVFGGATLRVDGAEKKPGDLLSYKGVMFEGVPNLVSVFGYINASWTLRAELVSQYACRLLNQMDARGLASATPVNREPDMARESIMKFTSGYVTRVQETLPKQGARRPWRQPQDYFKDLVRLRWRKIDDGFLEFAEKAPAERPADQAKPAEAA